MDLKSQQVDAFEHSAMTPINGNKKIQARAKPKPVEQGHQQLSYSTGLTRNWPTKGDEERVSNLSSLSLEPQKTSNSSDTPDSGNQ